MEATTVLRSLRGDLSPARESVVRDVFRSLVNLSRSGHLVDDVVGIPTDQGHGQIYSYTKRKVGMKRAMNDTVHVEDLKNAFCKGGGSGFSPVNGNAAPACDRGNISTGGWFSGQVWPDDGSPRTSRSGAKMWGAGGKAANNGVTVEQFLEQYR